MKYKVTISEVTSWEEGNESAGDYSHGVPMSQIMRAIAKEREDKVESDKWNRRMRRKKKLPFVYEDEAENEEEAKSFALQELYMQLCEYEYLEPIDCDCEVEQIDEEDA